MNEQMAFILVYNANSTDPSHHDKGIPEIHRGIPDVLKTSNVGDLNRFLKVGWRIVSSCPMSGSGASSDSAREKADQILVACMVVLEREKPPSNEQE